MINDKLDSLSCYAPISPNLSKAIAFLKAIDFTDLPCGKTFIDGENLICIVVDRVLNEEPLIWEKHNKYIDVHMVVSGRERIKYVANSNALVCDRKYDECEDSELYTGKPDCVTTIDCEPGDVVVFFPDEIHMTNGPYCCNESVKKVILKVSTEP